MEYKILFKTGSDIQYKLNESVKDGWHLQELIPLKTTMLILLYKEDKKVNKFDASLQWKVSDLESKVKELEGKIENISINLKSRFLKEVFPDASDETMLATLGGIDYSDLDDQRVGPELTPDDNWFS